MSTSTLKEAQKKKIIALQRKCERFMYDKEIDIATNKLLIVGIALCWIAID